jgi:integrase
MKGYFRVDAPKGFDGYPKRRPIYCKSRNAASKLRARIQVWKRNRAMPGRHIVTITEEDENWLGFLKNELGDLSILPKLVDLWKRTEGAAINKTTLSDLREEFLALKEGETENRRTLSDIRTRLQAFVYAFPSRYVHEIGTQEIRGYLNAIPRGYSRRNAYKWLAPAFAFAKEQRMLTVNPFESITRPDAGRSQPGIIRPDEFQRLLTTADAKFPGLVQFLACAGFAGLRTSELLAMYADDAILQWQDILFDKKLIVVRAEVAKQTRRKSGDRRFVKIEPALEEWLKPYQKKSGPVVEFTESWFRKLLRGTKKAPKETDSPTCHGLFRLAQVTPPDNGLRHSFASYWLARTGAEGVGKLAIQLGDSESVAKRHYIESLMPGDGDAWFGIRRESKAIA